MLYNFVFMWIVKSLNDWILTVTLNMTCVNFISLTEWVVNMWNSIPSCVRHTRWLSQKQTW